MRLEYFPLTPGPITPPHNPARNVLGGWLVTSYFGGRADPLTGRPGNHGGMDIAGSGVAGTAIVAPVEGYVNQAWDFSGGGNWTSLVTSDGHRFGFGHAASYAPGVNGRTVTAGTVIAYVGSTGHSTGPHLHFAYAPPRTAGWSDPYDLLVDVSARAATTDPAPTPQPAPTPEDAMFLVVLRLPDGRRFLWNGAVPAPTGDVQISYATDLYAQATGNSGPLKVYDVNPEFVDELRG